ncbi:patatin-like phospholipase family protein [Spongisporangium articulatum]|uniref:Patatin-like phospholipase family protein n=1 Tax=Spongisporangium articulatum TaxID=3362603 RepID=A0ABW8AK00_9ACTN
MVRGEAWAMRAAARATGEGAADVVRLGPEAQLAGPSGSGLDGERWGLVLGGGGVLGAAWLVGALSAFERAYGVDARQAELLVGTSAGSIVAAMLSAGVSVSEQRARQLAPSQGALPGGPGAALVSGPVARRRLRPGSPTMLRNMVRTHRGHLRDVPRVAVLTGLAPAGTAPMRGVRELIETAMPAGQWPSHRGVRVVALDYGTGDRVAFGAAGAPPAGLSEAVLASCAIPTFFAPVSIGDRRYVDGGAWSSTNADLVLAEEPRLDRLFVFAPMVSTTYDVPPDWKVRTERRIRIAITKRALSEARAVHEAGTAVTVVGPGPAELALIGFNLMASRPRRDVLLSAEQTVSAALTGSPADPVAAVVDAIDEAVEDEVAG